MIDVRLKTTILLLLLPLLINAQQDSSTWRPRSTLSFQPIFAYVWGNVQGVGDVFVNLRLGGEIRYGIDVWKNRYRVGPSVKVFWDDGDGIQSNWTYLIGAYQQYNFLPKKHNRLYLETGFYYSNFCFCEQGTFTVDATHTPGSLYLSLGGGWDIFLHPRWSFKLAYQHHILLNNPDAIQSFWGQRVFAGIDYYFHPRPRRPNIVQKRAARRAARAKQP